MPDMSPMDEAQAFGSQWLAPRQEAILGDIPGFGKTRQVIEAAKLQGAQRILVGCPAVARLNWERECRKWGLDLPILRVTDKGDHALPHRDAPQVVIASFDGIAGSAKLRGHLNAGLWDVLVLDEAQRLKSPDSRRTRAIYGQRVDGRKCLAAKAVCRWLLSGSIMPNGAGELWTHLHALWPGLVRDPYSGQLLDHEQFLHRYCVVKVNEYGSPKVLGYKDRAGLVALLQGIMLRREHVPGLPDIVIREDPVVVEVDDKRLAEFEGREEFDDLRAVIESADARANDLDGIEDDFIHLATLQRLTGLAKAKAAADLIAGECGGEDKVIVYAIHREVLEIMESVFALAGLKPAMIHGGVPDGQRNEEIDRFQNDPSCRVFVGQAQSCQEAITLTAGNRIWIVESPWSPEYIDQMLRRARRRGQRKTCFASFVAVAGSIDETKAAVCALKARNIAAIMQETYDGV